MAEEQQDDLVDYKAMQEHSAEVAVTCTGPDADPTDPECLNQADVPDPDSEVEPIDALQADHDNHASTTEAIQNESNVQSAEFGVGKNGHLHFPAFEMLKGSSGGVGWDPESDTELDRPLT